jgi:outer membrane protein assembly factor BamB
MSTTRELLAAALAGSIVAGLACQNHLPDVPAVPTGPAYCCKDTTYTFMTIVNDPDGDRVAVRFDWGDSVVSDWSGMVPSGDTITLTHVWSDTGTYEVSVQAKDEGQQRSGWSSALAVQVVLRRPPDMPHELVGPGRGGQDSSYAFSTSALHPDSITVAIRFAWGDGDTSDWSAFVASGETVAMSHVWTAPDTYAVTAQARDTGSGRSLWSLPHSIVIKPPDTLRKWRVQLGPGDLPYMNSSPAIGPDGTLYVGSNDSAVYAVGSEGAVKWRFRTNGNVRSSPSIAPDGTIYVGSNDNGLYAIDPDGVLGWRYSVGGDVTSSPAVAADGVVYVGSDDDYAYAFNPDGTLRWRFETDGNVEASPAVATDGTIYVGSFDGHLYALSPDGTLKWQYDTRDDVRSSPAIGSDGTIYFGTDSRTLLDFYALNPDSTVKWALVGDRVRSAPAIGADGSVYYGSTDDYLYALNPDSTLKWRYLAGGNVDAGPAIAADGTIYFGSDDNSLYALYLDGTLKWRYETDGSINSPPTIGADGTVYFISEDGYLYALKGASPLADSPWPKFHHDIRNTGRVGGGK